MDREPELYYYFCGAGEWHTSEDLYMLTKRTFKTKDDRPLKGTEVVNSLPRVD